MIPRPVNFFRLSVGLIGALNLAIAIAFYRQHAWVADIWPWDTGYDGLAPLSFYFFSSIAAAISAPLLWIAASGAIRAAAAGAFNLTVAFGGIAGYMVIGMMADPAPNLRVAAAASLIGLFALVNLVTWRLTRRLPTRDFRPMPAIVRGSFVLFTLTLIAVGAALVSVRPGVVPWDLTPEASVTYGWIFLGAATYFAHGAARPLWENAVGPLLGFLAYDVVLIAPFVQRFADVPPHLRTSLIVYTAVVVYSAVLATHFLFINTGTRLQSAGGIRTARH